MVNTISNGERRSVTAISRADNAAPPTLVCIDTNCACSSLLQLTTAECLYDARKRMSAVEYASSLEKKLREFERLLAGSSQPGPGSQVALSDPPAGAQGGSSEAGHDMIETMVDARNQERGGGAEDGSESDDGPSFGGLSLLRRLHGLCRRARASSSGSRFPAPHVRDSYLNNAFDAAPPESSPTMPWDGFAMLPSRKGVSHAIDVVVYRACCNLRFLDHETLHSLADETFQAIERASVAPSRKPLSLLFAVMALSRRFDPDYTPACNTDDDATSDGSRYFRASRALLDPSDCQDLVSLRTLLCMAIYAQTSSMMSVCYSYICMAAAAALQMGLLAGRMHGMSEEDKAWGRRIAIVLFIMDTYVTTALGLPRTLRDIDLDQVEPSLKEAQDPHHPGAETRAHARLIQILAEIMESNHPVTKCIPQINGFYGVPYCNIVQAESQLAGWFEQLNDSPTMIQPPEGLPFLRSQLVLRLYHAHVEMVLHRPFLHHALKQPRNDQLSLKAYACSSACIKACMQVVWLLEQMEASGVFNAAHWFLTLIVANTGACLVLFVTSAQGAPTTDETKEGVKRLKSFCARHVARSHSIRQCFMFLESYFPNDPPTDNERSLELQQRFEQNISFLQSAFDDIDHSTVEDLGATGPPGENLEALHLPNFDSFMHTSF